MEQSSCSRCIMMELKGYYRSGISRYVRSSTTPARSMWALLSDGPVDFSGRRSISISKFALVAGGTIFPVTPFPSSLQVFSFGGYYSPPS